MKTEKSKTQNMLYRKFLALIVVLFFVIFCGCSKNQVKLSDDVVAQANGKSLTRADIRAVVPVGTKDGDSIEMANRFIEAWVTNEIILQKALRNISENDETITKMVEDYRNALVVQKYLVNLIAQKTGKKPGEEDIAAWYQKNSSRFILDKCLIQGVYIAVPQSAPNIMQAQQWAKTGRSADLQKLQEYAIKYSISYDDFRNVWVPLPEMLSKMSSAIVPSDEFARKNNFYVTSAGGTTYILRIFSSIPSGQPAPKSYIEPTIIEMIMKERKEAFLAKFKKEILDKAIKDKNVLYHEAYKK